uniref:glutathione transferase n=1 Tax=Araucaria cunninghamii TaxID=56994 RepID=A0A0D6R1P8_ARACU
MATIKVHGTPVSTATSVVLACLHEKQIEYELVPVDPFKGEHKQPPFLALNPFGLVPAIQDGDLTLFESRAIIKYLAKKYESQGSNLLGSTFVEETLVEQWSQVEAQSFSGPYNAVVTQIMVMPIMGGETDEGVVESNLEKLKKVLDVYEDKLSKTKYLAGNSFSLADLQHLASINYLVNACGKGEIITSRKFVSAWWEDISSRPSWKKVLDMRKS